MLKIVIKKQDNKFKKINLLGHADYSSYGKDIVCSSASSIVITTVNAIVMFDKEYITYEEKKDNFIIVINKNDKIVDTLIQNMINMFYELENDYPKNIKIEEE